MLNLRASSPHLPACPYAQVPTLNLAGLDRVVMAVATDDSRLLLRQYSIRFKRSGTTVPRCALTEMGPRLDLSVRRLRTAAPELEKEAMRQPLLGKRKVRAAYCAASVVLGLYCRWQARGARNGSLLGRQGGKREAWPQRCGV